MPCVHTRDEDQRDWNGSKSKMEDLSGDFNEKITQIITFSATELAILLATIKDLHVSFGPMIS